jgi:hypothetical protein
MSEFGVRLPQSYDPAQIQKSVALKAAKRKKHDAPDFRFTEPTFGAMASIRDWVMSGELAKAVEAFNKGGVYTGATGVFISREFFLMRIFDAMEDLGKEQFEKFVPGIWDSVLRLYQQTFERKIVQQEEPVAASMDELYAEKAE